MNMRCVRLCVVIFTILYLAILVIFIAKQGIKPLATLASYSDSTNGHSAENNGLLIIGSAHRLHYKIASDNAQRTGATHIILMWDNPGIDEKNLAGCPDYNCMITHDRKLYKNSSAIVFQSPADLPEKRFPWQYYVFFSQESPAHWQAIQPYQHFFNLTLSYRLDSDAPSPYGYAVVRPKPNYDWKRNLNELITGKKKLVAWFVSNCAAPSGRDQYVNELKKWIPVDVYGACGNHTCPRMFTDTTQSNIPSWSYDTDEEKDFELDKDDCDRMLERDYKFYLAFENSICKDYITEKFWQKLTLKVVVIVLKRSIVEPYAPPGSFIAADDFRSPRDLAIYLRKLDSSPSAYEQLMDWRTNYRPIFLNGRVHDIRERPWGFCTLCKIISQNQRLRERKSYENPNDWWEKQAKCDYKLVKRLLQQNVIDAL